jgi:hypothetical protein
MASFTASANRIATIEVQLPTHQITGSKAIPLRLSSRHAGSSYSFHIIFPMV